MYFFAIDKGLRRQNLRDKGYAIKGFADKKVYSNYKNFTKFALIINEVCD